DRAQAPDRGLADRLPDVAAGIAQLVGEFDDEDAVLGGKADEHDDADLAVEIERLAHQGEPDHPAGHRQRHGGDDHRGMDEAFELGGEDQIDDEYGEQEDDVDGAARLPERMAFAAIADRHHFGRGGSLLLEEGKRLAQRIIRAETALESDGAQLVVAAEITRSGDLAHAHEVGQRHQLPAAAADVDGFELGHGTAIGRLGLDDHPIFLAPIDIGTDPAGTEQALQRLADVLHRHAEVAGAGGVDVDVELRLGLL